MSEDPEMNLRSVRQRSEAGYYGLDWHPAEDDVEFLLSLIENIISPTMHIMSGHQ